MDWNIHKTCHIPGLNDIFDNYLSDVEMGTFIDVGAYNGERWSNVWGFIQLGWKGLLIEPTPNLVNDCKRIHGQNKNVEILQACAGSYNGKIKLYHPNFSDKTSPMNTTDLESVELYQKEQKHFENDRYNFSENTYFESDVYTLNSILEMNPYLSEKPSILSVDVEGAEWDVLQGYDIEKWRPRMVMVELHELYFDGKLKNKRTNRLKLNNILNYFYENDYVKIHCDAINSIFIPKEIWNNTNKKTDVYWINGKYFTLEQITNQGFEILGDNNV